ncbi:MAG TPA: phage holin family protein [Fimbriimonadaceae bacterium]|nr:phage holin family protein [Fimbriimonadaceae bacterium]
MFRLLLRWVLLVVAVVATAFIEEALGLGLRTSVQEGGSAFSLFIAVAVLALVNATLGKVLKFLTIPLNCLTLGLFSLVVNAFMLIIVANMNLGIEIEGEGLPRFFSALVGSILISAINAMLGTFVGDKGKDD